MDRLQRAMCAGLTAFALALFALTAPVTAWADTPEIAAAEEAATQETLPQETAPEETAPQETTPETAQEAEEASQEAASQETPPAAPQNTAAQAQPDTAASQQADPAPTEPEPQPPAMSIRVPLFYQTDYPDVLYSAGTVATDGCGITCLAMVATYLTGSPYLPDELAGYFGGYMEGVITNLDRLEAASDVLQLPWRRAADFHDAIAAARSGKIVIAMMDQNSLFTSSQHFIVIVGTTEDGKFLVNDPYEPNYSKWNLKNAFLYGFTQGDLCAGFCGGWIYDPDAMPDEPFLYREETPEVECRYPGVTLTADEKELLARMVWVEARGEDDQGQQAVAEVVLNRLVSDGFSDNIRDIIYSDNQFRSTKWLDEAEPTQAQYEAVDAALNGPYILPLEVVHFATYAVTDRVWGTIGGHTFCYPPTGID